LDPVTTVSFPDRFGHIGDEIVCHPIGSLISVAGVLGVRFVDGGVRIRR
jgi:hypothetical protein